MRSPVRDEAVHAAQSPRLRPPCALDAPEVRQRPRHAPPLADAAPRRSGIGLGKVDERRVERPDQVRDALDDYADPVAAEVGLGDGRYLETTWDFDAGYYWFDQLDRAGYFYDKVLALQVLTDPETFFVGKDTASDVRTYALNFHTTFGRSTTAFFRGLLAEDWASIGPRATGGEIVWPDPLQIADGDMPGVPIDPNAGFTIQLYAAVFGMALVPMTYDHQFLDRSRVWVRGGPEGVELDPAAPVVEFTDPRSGIVYVARSYPDGAGVEEGIGARMLLRASALAAAGPDGEAELVNVVDTLNVVRALTWELGFGSGVVDPETGIHYQNRGSYFSLEAGHANVLEPRKRTLHTLLPGMLFREPGRPWVVAGSMGGCSIPAATTRPSA